MIRAEEVIRADGVSAADGDPAEAGTAAEILAAAANRSLVLVVRDAHRSESTRDLVMSVLADRPDAVLIEMGLPVWQPPAGSCRAYVATYGASRANGQAAAEVLGLVSRLAASRGRSAGQPPPGRRARLGRGRRLRPGEAVAGLRVSRR